MSNMLNSNNLFTSEIDEKFLKAIKLKNDLVEKCMGKVRQRQKVDFKDLNPMQINKEQITIVNEKLDKIKHKTFFIVIYFLGSMAFSLKYMFKLYRLKVPLRKSIPTWLFSLVSSNLLFKSYEGNLQGSFENELEDLAIDHIFEINKIENEEEKSKKKQLCLSQLNFYKQNNNFKHL